MPSILEKNKWNDFLRTARKLGVILLFIVGLLFLIFLVSGIWWWTNSHLKASELDRQLKSWQDTSLLAQEGGRFYFFNYDYDAQKGPASIEDVYLYEFSPKENRWEKHFYPAFRQNCVPEGCNTNPLHKNWDVRNRTFIGFKNFLSSSPPFTSSFFMVDLKSRQEEWLSFTADRAFLSPEADRVLLLSCMPGNAKAVPGRGDCKARIYDRTTRTASPELPVSLNEDYAVEDTLDWDPSGQKILYRNAEGFIEEYVLASQKKQVYYVNGKNPHWGADGQVFYYEPTDSCGLYRYIVSSKELDPVFRCDGKVFFFDNYLTPSKENAVGVFCLGPEAPRACNFFGVILVNLKDTSRRFILKQLENQRSFPAVWDPGESKAE